MNVPRAEELAWQNEVEKEIGKFVRKEVFVVNPASQEQNALVVVRKPFMCLMRAIKTDIDIYCEAHTCQNAYMTWPKTKNQNYFQFYCAQFRAIKLYMSLQFRSKLGKKE